MRCIRPESAVLLYLRRRVAAARGSMVSVRARHVARMCNWERRGEVIELQIVLDSLARAGLLIVLKRTSRGVVYALTKDSPLWDALKNGTPVDEILARLTAGN